MEITNELKTVKWGIDEYNEWILLGSPENTKVTHLDLSHNNIKGVFVLNNLPNLQDLYCSHNQITKIEELDLPNLEVLYCHYNQITEFEKNKLPKLRELKLYNNQLISLSFEIPNTLRFLYYSGNPVEYIAPKILRFLNRGMLGMSVQEQTDHKGVQTAKDKYVQNIMQTSLAKLPKKTTIFNVREYIMKDNVLTKTVKHLLLDYMDDTTVHSELHVTFEELLRYELSLAEDYNKSTNIKENLNFEILNPQCELYIGRMSLLIKMFEWIKNI